MRRVHIVGCGSVTFAVLEGCGGIRVNDQWRICFVWRDGDAYEVEIVDDHG